LSHNANHELEYVSKIVKDEGEDERTETASDGPVTSEVVGSGKNYAICRIQSPNVIIRQ
jgi:hypothetical protein